MSLSPARVRLLLLLAAALVLQAVLLRSQGMQRPLFGDELRYHQRALDIAAGREVSPEFVWPPLGEYVLATVYRLAGPSRDVVTAFQVALFLGAALSLRVVAKRVLGGEAAPDLAAAFFLLDPQVAAFTQYLWPEVLHLFLALAGIAVAFGRRNPGAARLGAGGALLGLAILTKNVLFPFVPVLALAAALGGDTPARARLRRGAALVAGCLLVTTPVVVSNGLRHGTFAIADASALNVWTGLTDPADRTYDANAGWRVGAYLESGSTPRERNAWAWRQIRDEVAQRGGWARVAVLQAAKQYRRLLWRESFFTDQLPGGRIATGEARLDGPPRTPVVLWSYAAWALTLALASLGIALLDPRRLRGGLGVAVLFLAYNAALFLFVLAKTRFRLPFLPALDLLAAFAVVTLAAGPRPAHLVARLAAGSVLAGAALYAAFG